VVSAEPALDPRPPRVVVPGLVRVAAAVVAVALIILTAVVWFSRRSDSGVADLGEAGLVTAWALPVARFALNAWAVLTVGCLLTAAVLLPRHGVELTRLAHRWMRHAAVTAGAWVITAFTVLALTLSEMFGQPLSAVLNAQTLLSFISSVPQGRALLLVVLITGGLAVTARFVTTVNGAVLSLVAALAGLLPLVFTGHSAASANYELAVTSLAIHVLAAALWLGGLAALLKQGRMDRRMLLVVARRFSRIALGCFIAVSLSGVANALTRLDNLNQLFASSYGLLIVAKAAALGSLGGIGWVHRTRTIPRLEHGAVPFLRLAAGEVVVMAAAMALAVGLSRTAPPPSAAAPMTPARVLLGYDMPPPVTLARLLGDWRLDPLFLIGAVVAAGVYLAGVRRVRRSGKVWPARRTVAWLAGLLFLVVHTSSGISRYSWVLFSVQMAQHMALTMLTPILLVLAAPATLALWALPSAGRENSPGPREWLLTILRSRWVWLLTHPLVALGLLAASFYALYFTPIYAATMHSRLGHWLMLVAFLMVGILLFWPIVGVGYSPHRVSYRARIALAFASLPIYAIFGMTVMMSTTVIADDWYTALARPWGADLLADQRIGGGIAWGLGVIPMLVAQAVLFIQGSRRGTREIGRAEWVSRSGPHDQRRASAPVEKYDSRLATDRFSWPAMPSSHVPW